MTYWAVLLKPFFGRFQFSKVRGIYILHQCSVSTVLHRIPNPDRFYGLHGGFPSTIASILRFHITCSWNNTSQERKNYLNARGSSSIFASNHSQLWCHFSQSSSNSCWIICILCRNSCIVFTTLQHLLLHSSLDFDVVHQLVITSFVSIRYWREKWEYNATVYQRHCTTSKLNYAQWNVS
jgi:hypothetical protein